MTRRLATGWFFGPPDVDSPSLDLDFSLGRGLEGVSIVSPSGMNSTSGPMLQVWAPGNALAFVAKGAGAPNIERVRVSRLRPVNPTPGIYVTGGSSITITQVTDTAPDGTTVNAYEITIVKVSGASSTAVIQDDTAASSPDMPFLGSFWIKHVSGSTDLTSYAWPSGYSAYPLSSVLSTTEYRRFVTGVGRIANRRAIDIRHTVDSATSTFRILYAPGWYPLIEDVAWGITLPASRVLGSVNTAPLAAGWYTDPDSGETWWVPTTGCNTAYCWTEPAGTISSSGYVPPSSPGARITTGGYRALAQVTQLSPYSVPEATYWTKTDVPGLTGKAGKFLAQDTSYYVTSYGILNTTKLYFEFLIERPTNTAEQAPDFMFGIYRYDGSTFAEHWPGGRIVVTWATQSAVDDSGNSATDWAVTFLGTGPNGGQLVNGWMHATAPALSTLQDFFYPNTFVADTTNGLIGKGVIIHYRVVSTTRQPPLCPIVTDGAAFTRLADYMYRPWTEHIGPWTFVVDLDAKDSDESNTPRIVGTEDADTPLAYTSALVSYDGTARQFVGLTHSSSAYRVSVRRDAGQPLIAATVVGSTYTEAQENGGTWTPTAVSRMQVGSYGSGSGEFRRRIKRFIYWRRKLASTEVQNA